MTPARPLRGWKPKEQCAQDYEKILARKQAYYGKTEASFHFAAEEYAEQFKAPPKLPWFVSWINLDFAAGFFFATLVHYFTK